MKNRKTFTLRLDEETLNKLAYISTKNKRSINNQIECMVDKLISDFLKKTGQFFLLLRNKIMSNVYPKT